MINRDDPENTMHFIDKGADVNGRDENGNTPLMRASMPGLIDGVYHHDLTKKISAKKIDGIEATNADIVATACPGCMVNLIDHLLQNKMPRRSPTSCSLLSGGL